MGDSIKVAVDTISRIDGRISGNVHDMLWNWNRLVREHNIPNTADVRLELPGGGDYSYVEIDAREIKVVVTWSTPA